MGVRAIRTPDWSFGSYNVFKHRGRVIILPGQNTGSLNLAQDGSTMVSQTAARDWKPGSRLSDRSARPGSGIETRMSEVEVLEAMTCSPGTSLQLNQPNQLLLFSSCASV